MKIRYAFKRAVSCILIFTVAFQLLFAINASAAEQVIFKLKCGNLAPGNETTVICSVDNAPHIGGFTIQISCDKDNFKYVEKSFKAAHSVMDDATVKYNSTTGTLYVVWETGAGEGITQSGDLFSFKFLASETLREEQYVFPMKVTECFTDDAVPKNISVGTYKGVATLSLPQNVKNLIAKIAEIGTVEYTDNCLVKIVECETVYKSMKASERSQISNYKTLIEARNTYNELAQKALEDMEKAAAQKYRETYADILSKTVKTLVLADKQVLTDARDAWNALPTSTQKALLINEKNLLNKLNARMIELEKIEQGRLEEEELKKEALAFKAALYKDWGQVLSLTVDTVTTDYSGTIGLALSAADGYCLMNSYCNEFLKDEIDLLNKLSKKVAELSGEDTTEGFNAQTFLKYYGYLMKKTADELTLSDVQDIKVAYQLMQLLDAQSQAELSKEVALLDEFMIKVSELEAQANADGTVIATSDTKTVINTVRVKGDSTYSMSTSGSDAVFAVPNDNIKQLTLFGILTGVSVLVFTAALVSYLLLKRKEFKEKCQKEVVV